jgi:hypothetical protein
VAASYPVLLRQAGYRTGFIGKIGVVVPRGATGQMFDSFMPLNRNPYFTSSMFTQRFSVAERMAASSTRWV